MGRRGGLRRAGASRAHVKTVRVPLLQGGTCLEEPPPQSSSSNPSPPSDAGSLVGPSPPKRHVRVRQCHGGMGGAAPIPSAACPNTSTGLSGQTHGGAAGGEGIGEALPGQRAKHPQGQTSATRPRYLFVTCLQPARDHFFRCGLV